MGKNGRHCSDGWGAANVRIDWGGEELGNGPT